jgi:hypothetical protein
LIFLHPPVAGDQVVGRIVLAPRNGGRKQRSDAHPRQGGANRLRYVRATMQGTHPKRWQREVRKSRGFRGDE